MPKMQFVDHRAFQRCELIPPPFQRPNTTQLKYFIMFFFSVWKEVQRHCLSTNGKSGPHAHSRQEGDGNLPCQPTVKKRTQNTEVVKQTVKFRTILRFLPGVGLSSGKKVKSSFFLLWYNNQKRLSMLFKNAV